MEQSPLGSKVMVLPEKSMGDRSVEMPSHRVCDP